MEIISSGLYVIYNISQEYLTYGILSFFINFFDDLPLHLYTFTRGFATLSVLRNVSNIAHSRLKEAEIAKNPPNSVLRDIWNLIVGVT